MDFGNKPTIKYVGTSNCWWLELTFMATLITLTTLRHTRRSTDHTYHDFSRFLSSGGVLRKVRAIRPPFHPSTEELNLFISFLKSKKGGKNFPAKVHRMLSDDCNKDVITWMVSLTW